MGKYNPILKPWLANLYALMVPYIHLNALIRVNAFLLFANHWYVNALYWRCKQCALKSKLCENCMNVRLWLSEYPLEASFSLKDLNIWAILAVESFSVPWFVGFKWKYTWFKLGLKQVRYFLQIHVACEARTRIEQVQTQAVSKVSGYKMAEHFLSNLKGSLFTVWVFARSSIKSGY